MVERAHFLRIYDTLRARRKADRSLPPAVLANRQRILARIRTETEAPKLEEG